MNLEQKFKNAIGIEQLQEQLESMNTMYLQMSDDVVQKDVDKEQAFYELYEAVLEKLGEELVKEWIDITEKTSTIISEEIEKYSKKILLEGLQ